MSRYLALGRALGSRSGSTSLPLLIAVIGLAFGCGPEPEPPERPAMPDLAEYAEYDVWGFDTVPIPEPLVSICERPDRIVDERSDAITGPGTRVPPLGEFGTLHGELEIPLRCVARTVEEQEMLLQMTPLADSARWRDPNTMVLLASRGFASHLGPQVHLRFVTQDGDSLIAHVVRIETGSGCTVQTEVTYPISVVAIPASGAKVVFREYVLREPPCS